jgi:hypothetical protein
VPLPFAIPRAIDGRKPGSKSNLESLFSSGKKRPFAALKKRQKALFIQ